MEETTAATHLKITDLTYKGLIVLTKHFGAPFFIDETTGVISVGTEDGEVLPLNPLPKPNLET